MNTITTAGKTGAHDMNRDDNRDVWGILGGMGPLASAEFLNSIYQQSQGRSEQDLPVVVLISDPRIPDRTQSFLNGHEALLLKELSRHVGQLMAMGVTRIVICCMTIHPLIPRLPVEWQEKIVSLLDLVFDSIRNSPRKHLLVCTEGTRKQKLFENHPLWPGIRDKIILPDDKDQALIHNLIYEIKSNCQGRDQVFLLEKLLVEYGVQSYIAGCTEVHILAKKHEQLRGRNQRAFCIDPLRCVVEMMVGRAYQVHS
jgi:aspartate racemase